MAPRELRVRVFGDGTIMGDVSRVLDEVIAYLAPKIDVSLEPSANFHATVEV